MLTIFEFKDTPVKFKKEERLMICLTDMAKAHGKKVNDWLRLKSTNEFLSALSESTNITVDQLIRVNESSGKNEERGTWGTEDVALEFAGWCSVQFKIWVNTQIKTLLTEGSVTLKPMTPAESLLQMAQLMVEHERQLLALTEKQNEQEQTIKSLKAEVADQKSLAEVHDMEIRANCAELDRFRNGQGHWFSILAYANLKGIQLSLVDASRLGRQASALCRTENLVPQQISDPRFGKVNSYPQWVLDEIFS